MRFLIPLLLVGYVLMGGHLAENEVPPAQAPAPSIESAPADGGMVVEEDLEIELGEHEYSQPG